MRRAAKRDVSEPEIVNTLMDAGFTVHRLNGVGVPDLLCGFRSRTWLVECKSSHKGYGKSLNPNQQRFADNWRGSPVVILRNGQEAMDWACQMAVETAGRAA